MDKTQIFLGEKLLAEVDENKTVTVLTEQRKAKENITVYFGASGTIRYNGATTGIQAGQTVILECADQILLTNIIVKTAGAEILQLDAPLVYIYNDTEDGSLSSPFIYIYDDTEDGSLSSPVIYVYNDELGYSTALLGTAILGSAILGLS